MEIKVEVMINKSIAAVWEVIGNQFGHAFHSKLQILTITKTILICVL